MCQALHNPENMMVSEKDMVPILKCYERNQVLCESTKKTFRWSVRRDISTEMLEEK